jgi:class 3 adenylate cyclase
VELGSLVVSTVVSLGFVDEIAVLSTVLAELGARDEYLCKNIGEQRSQDKATSGQVATHSFADIVAFATRRAYSLLCRC